MSRVLKFTCVLVYFFLFYSFLHTPYSYSFSLFDKKPVEKDPFAEDRNPKVEPMDHMPKGEREDWEYNLFMMEEPDEYILMFEQTTKRYMVPIDESSENLSIITRRRIERMNAHSAAEVLKRVCGVFVKEATGEMGSTALIKIENSAPRHTRVMLDGVPLNSLSSGNADTNFIPVGIIDRIEILKGPASSVWGSSLGGVVNIISRTGGDDLDKPASAVTATYGENHTYDARTTISKKFNNSYGVLINATNQETQAIMPGRGFRKKSLFAKLSYENNETTKADFSTLVSDTFIDESTSTSLNEDSDAEKEIMISRLNFEFQPMENTNISLSGYHINSNFKTDIESQFFLVTDRFDDTSSGGSAKLHFKMWGLSTTTMGIDFSKNRLEQYDHYSEPGFVDITETSPEYETYALYFNQTYDFYHFMVLPGIRIDYNDITKEFISPSLGLSINFSDDFVLRLTAARGFSAPPVAWISEGFWNTYPNPDLKREEVWSYQAGFETTELWFMAIKSNIFYHDMKNQFLWRNYSGSQDMAYNGSSMIRQGAELEITTKAFYKFILYASGAYVHTKDRETDDSFYANTGNIGLRYNDRQTFRYELNGHFKDFDVNESKYYQKTDIIWDFTLCKTLKYWGNYHIEIIGKVHNIFDGDQFYAGKKAWTYSDQKNPHRWVEAGVSFKF